MMTPRRPIKCLAGIVLLSLSGCGPQAGTLPKHVALPIPPKAKPVETEAVRKSAVGASREGAVASASVSRIVSLVAGLEVDLKAAVTEADRLRRLKTATEEELGQLWRDLTEIHVRHNELGTEAREAKEALSRQKELYETAEFELGKMERAARAVSEESELLRSSLVTAEALRKASDGALVTANSVAAENAGRADKLSGEIRIYRIAGGILLSVIVILLVLKFAKPL